VPQADFVTGRRWLASARPRWTARNKSA